MEMDGNGSAKSQEAPTLLLLILDSSQIRDRVMWGTKPCGFAVACICSVVLGGASYLCESFNQCVPFFGSGIIAVCLTCQKWWLGWCTWWMVVSETHSQAANCWVIGGLGSPPARVLLAAWGFNSILTTPSLSSPSPHKMPFSPLLAF